eukprot:11965566-Alexandrium_andersonii.AAC.1
MRPNTQPPRPPPLPSRRRRNPGDGAEAHAVRAPRAGCRGAPQRRNVGGAASVALYGKEKANVPDERRGKP